MGGVLIVALLLLPRPIHAQMIWHATVGAQSHDKGHQALAFLPNEIWIHAGDSVMWEWDVDEIHTLSFLKPGQIRQPFPFGCGHPPATVVFAGVLAGRPVVSLAHSGGLRTSYEPVRAAVRVGQLVDSTTALGTLEPGHPGCAAVACLHWGAMWGPAARADYVDPLGLLASTRIRLKPLHPVVRAPCARHLLARRCVLVRDTPLISVLLCTLAPKGRTSGVPQARGCAWSCTARSLATVTWV